MRLSASQAPAISTTELHLYPRLSSLPIPIPLSPQVWHNPSLMVKLHAVNILHKLLKYSECIDQLLSFGGYQAMIAQIQRNIAPNHTAVLEDCIYTLANRRIGLEENLTQERALQERVAGLIMTLEELQ